MRNSGLFHASGVPGVPGVHAILSAILLIGVAAASALAIQPDKWVHTTEADFNSGETENIVITNLGDLKLAAATRTIGSVPEQISIINDLQRLGDDVYLAAGPEASLLRQRGDAIEQVLELKGSQVFALSTYEGRLLMGVSGSPSRLVVLREGEAETLIELTNVRYIWDILVNGRAIYLATGTEGQLLRIDLSAAEADVGGDGAPAEDAEAADDPRVSVLLDAAQTNLLCLGRDTEGNLYAGSDTDGLIYRVSMNDVGGADTFVLYDAAEPEITALLVRGDGTVFAGTADAKQAQPGRLNAARTMDLGRPESPESPESPEAAEAAEAADGMELPESDEPAMDLPEEELVPPEDEGLPPEEEGVEPLDVETGDAVEPDEQEDPQFVKPDGSDEMTRPSPGKDPVPFGPRLGFLIDSPELADSGSPTKEQLDRLRAIIKGRLETVRGGGELSPLNPKPLAAGVPIAAGQPGLPGAARRPSSRPRKKGNAIYRIDPDHFVAEVFRESVMILQIAENRDSLLVATGNEGQIYRVDPDGEETTILVDLESQQVPALLAGEDHFLLGTANPATLVSLDRGFASTGTYMSTVLDAAQVSRWGKLHLTAQIAPGARVKVEVRSGNVEDTDQAAWSDWTDPIVLEPDAEVEDLAPRELPIRAPSARFLQYRLTMAAEGADTPVIDKLTIAYVVPNLRPQITAFNTRYADQRTVPAQVPTMPAGSRSRGGEGAKHDPRMTLAWKAIDPNKDALSYRLEYRSGSTTRWLTMAEELTVTKYVWQTHRVPDGHYVLRVIASDAASNPPVLAKTAIRRSNPVVVDNTPPALAGDLTARIEKDQARINVAARDALSPIRAVHWSLDAADDWQPALPDDMIFDSTSEDLVITIPDLEPGPHVITVRVTDQRNNALYKAQVIEVE